MGVYAGPEVVSDGLVLSLDAGNTRGFDKYENLALNSEAINSWANNGSAISISANSQIAPDGTLTADVLSQTAVTGAGRWVSSVGNRTYTAGVTYTLSIWLKKISGTDGQPSIDLWINGVPQQSVGTITTEWVRYSKSFTPASTISTNTFTGLNIGWNTNGVANNFTFAAWGFQVEVGSTATDYYPTTSTTKTRGSTLIDLSGRGNNGTLTNGPTFNSSNGGSIVFDGTNDYITIPNGNYLNTNSFTVSLWIYLDNIVTTFTDYCFLEKNVYNTSGISASLGTGGSTGNRILYVRYSTTGNAALDYIFAPSAFLVTFDAWHNVVLLFEYNDPNSQISTYIDGIYIQTSTPVSGTFVSNSSALNIGNPGPGNGVYHKGKISSYQIYNRALTAAEIQQNFNATKSRYGL